MIFFPCFFCPWHNCTEAERAYNAERENARLRSILIENGLDMKEKGILYGIGEQSYSEDKL